MSVKQPETSKRHAISNVGVLYHPKLAESRVMAAEILEFIENLGRTAWVSSSWDETAIKYHLQQADMLVTLGGDGSLLRATRMTARRAVPVLGIHMGHLGFLVEVQPAEWRERIAQMLEGDYWVENRMMVQAHHYHREQLVNTYEALNEVVISRGQMARVVNLHTYIDGGFLTTYKADGLIISTSTGSTAYSLAVGGPIMPPELENILIIPVAPHLSLGRAIILSKGVSVRVEVSTDHTAVLTIDGQMEIQIADGDSIRLNASPWMGRFVRLQAKNYFYKTLTQRLGK